VLFSGLQKPHSDFNPLGDVGLRIGATRGLKWQHLPTKKKEEGWRESQYITMPHFVVIG